MSNDWQWFEAIKRSKYPSGKASLVESAVPDDLDHLIQCVELLRRSLEKYRGISSENDVTEGSSYSDAEETLNRCADGNFRTKLFGLKK